MRFVVFCIEKTGIETELDEVWSWSRADRIGVVSYCNHLGSGNPVAGSPPLNISSSPMANNGRWVSTDFSSERNGQGLGALVSWRERGRKSVLRLSPSTGTLRLQEQRRTVRGWIPIDF